MISHVFVSSAQPVALKVIDLKGLKDSISREMLQTQISILKAVSSPNILRCYDVLKTINHCYIITQLCQQGDLATLLKNKGKFSERQAISLLVDIVSGYKQLGEHNILHRDLKPANVFISKGVFKIADFGFAKKSKLSSFRQKYNVGSPLYMSPQSLKHNVYSLKNDVWSIGIIFFELLYGTTPWDCRSERQLIQKISNQKVSFPTSPAVSEEAKQFIRRCLQVDQPRRMGLDELSNHPIIKKCYQQRQQRQVNNSAAVLRQRNFNQTQYRPVQIQFSEDSFSLEQKVRSTVQQINYCRLLFKLMQQLGQQSRTFPHLRFQLNRQITQLKREVHPEKVKKVIDQYYVKYMAAISGKQCWQIENVQSIALKQISNVNQRGKQLLCALLLRWRGVKEDLSIVIDQPASRISEEEIRTRLGRALTSLE